MCCQCPSISNISCSPRDAHTPNSSLGAAHASDRCYLQMLTKLDRSSIPCSWKYHRHRNDLSTPRTGYTVGLTTAQVKPHLLPRQHPSCMDVHELYNARSSDFSARSLHVPTYEIAVGLVISFPDTVDMLRWSISTTNVPGMGTVVWQRCVRIANVSELTAKQVGL